MLPRPNRASILAHKGGRNVSKPQILHFDEIPSIARGGGIISKPLAGPWMGAQGISTGVSTSPPGTAISFHTHNVEEAVTLLAGDAVCEFGGQSFRLKPWDTTYMPAGISHRFVNVGEVPMSILWVYAGDHVTRTSSATGETVEHMSPGDLGGR
jgi:HTH-type transcriptional regulator, repressor for puuD